MRRGADYCDWEFERCKERFPQNPTCSTQEKPTPEEPAASRECRNQVEARFPTVEACMNEATEPLNQAGGEPYLENPAGVADPITFEMGTTLWDRW